MCRYQQDIIVGEALTADAIEGRRVIHEQNSKIGIQILLFNIRKK